MNKIDNYLDLRDELKATNPNDITYDMILDRMDDAWDNLTVAERDEIEEIIRTEKANPVPEIKPS
jgi:hypothetical protein